MADELQITWQPSDDGDPITAPRSAYLPFRFQVRSVGLLTGAIKVGYCLCNIFSDGGFLTSIASTAPYDTVTPPPPIGGNPDYYFEFDIASLLQTVGLTKYRFKVMCTFQLAVIQDDGTIGEPIYTSDDSNEYTVLNLALQYPDGISVKSHLSNYIVSPGTLLPLTHRPARLPIGLNQSDLFPYFREADPPYSINLILCYKILGQPVYHEKTVAYNQTDEYLPFGTAELATLFPAVNFANLTDYFLRVENDIYTPTQVINTCTDKDIRILFLNYLGTMDAINMRLDLVEHATESDSFQLARVPGSLTSPSFFNNRINIRANNTYTVSTDKLEENDIPWFQELADSPKAWIQDGDLRVPIVIEDGSFVVRKGSARYRYQVSMKFTLSNDFLTIRN